MPSNEEIKACVNGIQTIKALRLHLSHFADNTRANGIQTIKALRLRPMPAPFFLLSPAVKIFCLLYGGRHTFYTAAAIHVVRRPSTGRTAAVVR